MENKSYYYLVKGGDAMKAITDYIAGAHAFNDHLKAICEKYGAKGWLLWGPHVGGLQFDHIPGAPWKQIPKNKGRSWPDVYAPDSRRKEGKAIWAEIKSVRSPGFCVGGTGDSYVIRDRFMCHPGFEQIGDQYILTVPIHYDKTKQFIPVGDVEQLKTSEYWALKETASANRG